MKRATVFALVVMLAAGCASARTRPSPASTPSPAGAGTAPASLTPEEDLSLHLRSVRELTRRARPAPALVAERWSPDLRAAVEEHAAAPTASSMIRLAQAYARLGILDQAREHLTEAARLDPHESAAWDGLARIWRDWGFPQLGLGDAHRAVYAAGASPIPHNTLGTILQALGKGREARQQFAAALALDPAAAYASNNLCYSWLMEADAGAAQAECRRALAIDPQMVTARNNLALATAIAGDAAGAAEIFGAVGGEAAAQYNLGIAYLAQRRYSAAADAFDKAAVLQPSLTLASVRARQARQHAVADSEKEGPSERR
jgi:Flp pilus assembly protein TadD